ncbi:hypothetical protein [Pseudoduganella sp. UC29_71]|uniref:hypothetical protein n=1 Tax=Pseudoduganella sp. UC29_71 TaxID=3350174 RepID=UPI00366AFB5C
MKLNAGRPSAPTPELVHGHRQVVGDLAHAFLVLEAQAALGFLLALAAGDDQGQQPHGQQRAGRRGQVAP